MGCIVSRQQFSENVAERAAEEWRHFSDTEEGDVLSTGPHHQREGRYELDREFLYPGIVGIDVARRGGQLSGATSQYELFYDQRRRSVRVFPAKAGIHARHGHRPSPV
jgi:hypothetical protein